MLANGCATTVAPVVEPHVAPAPENVPGVEVVVIEARGDDAAGELPLHRSTVSRMATTSRRRVRSDSSLPRRST